MANLRTQNQVPSKASQDTICKSSWTCRNENFQSKIHCLHGDRPFLLCRDTETEIFFCICLPCVVVVNSRTVRKIADVILQCMPTPAGTRIKTQLEALRLWSRFCLGQTSLPRRLNKHNKWAIRAGRVSSSGQMNVPAICYQSSQPMIYEGCYQRVTHHFQIPPNSAPSQLRFFLFIFFTRLSLSLSLSSPLSLFLSVLSSAGCTHFQNTTDLTLIEMRRKVNMPSLSLSLSLSHTHTHTHTHTHRGGVWPLCSKL